MLIQNNKIIPAHCLVCNNQKEKINCLYVEEFCQDAATVLAAGRTRVRF